LAIKVKEAHTLLQSQNQWAACNEWINNV
jgi:hypothetical protein